LKQILAGFYRSHEGETLSTAFVAPPARQCASGPSPAGDGRGPSSRLHRGNELELRVLLGRAAHRPVVAEKDERTSLDIHQALHPAVRLLLEHLRVELVAEDPARVGIRKAVVQHGYAVLGLQAVGDHLELQDADGTENGIALERLRIEEHLDRALFRELI